MAYKTNAVIIGELESLNVAYDDDMTNAELQHLLDKALAGDEENKEVADLPIIDESRLAHSNIAEAKPAQAKEVNLGVATINDHEQRIFALEQKQ